MDINLNGLIDQDFSVDSFSDFLGHCQAKISKFIGFLGTIADYADPEIDSEAIDLPSDSELLSELESIGIPKETILSCQQGWCTVEQFIGEYTGNLQEYWAGDLDGIEFGSSLIVIYDSQNYIHRITLNEFLDDIKSNMYASIAQRFALSSAKFSNVADRITAFMTNIENVLDLNDSTVLSSVSFYKEKLLGSDTPFQLFDQFMRVSGAQQLNDNILPFSLQDFDITQYTGANPLGSLSFACVADGIQSAGKILGAAAMGIWNAIKKGANWIWNKAKKYTVEVFSDPYDVTDNGNSNTKFCFENFQYQREYDQLVTFNDNNILINDKPWDLEDVTEQCDDMIGHWYLIKTMGGEVALKPTQILPEPDSMNPNNIRLNWKGTVLFKPYSLRSDIPCNTYSEFILNASGMLDGMYLDCKASEIDLFNSFTFGSAITQEIIKLLGDEAHGMTNVWTPSWQQPASGYQITNLDWLKKAAGYRQVGDMSYFDTCTYCGVTLISLGTYLLKLVLGCKLKSNSNTNFYSEYVPYVQDTQSMSQGRFGIKTDSTNQDVANAFTIALVAIVTIAIVIITGAIIVKRVAKKLWWKRTEFVGQCDNAMWNGKTLSTKDKRKYIRYSRKLNVSQLLSKGMTSAESTNEKLSSLNQTIATTMSSITKGDNPENVDCTLSELYHKIVG